MPFEKTPRQSASPDDSGATARVSAIGARRATTPKTFAPFKVNARVLSIVLTSVIVVATLMGLVAHATSDPVGALGVLLQIPTPTPEPTLVPGADQIAFSNAVPWGALTIDGKGLNLNALLMSHQSGTIFARGRHHLVYQARYFKTVRCVFSIPAANGDTCLLDTSMEARKRAFTASERAIDLGASFDRLAPDQQSALLAQIQEQLKASALVAPIAPGDRYLDAHGAVATASQPLTLSLKLAFPDNTSIGGDICASLCKDSSAPIPGLSGSADAWLLQITPTATWALTDAAGRPVGSLNVQEEGPTFVHTDIATIGLWPPTTTTGWQIDGVSTLTAQAAAAAQVRAIITALKGGGIPTPSSAQEGVGANPLQGCYIVLQVPFADGSGMFQTTLLWRFGVVFTTDDSGQGAMAFLPRANATEFAAISSLKRQGVTAVSFT